MIRTASLLIALLLLTACAGNVHTGQGVKVTACAGGMATLVAAPALNLINDVAVGVHRALVGGQEAMGGEVVAGEYRAEVSSTRGPGRNRDCARTHEEVTLGW